MSTMIEEYLDENDVPPLEDVPISTTIKSRSIHPSTIASVSIPSSSIVETKPKETDKGFAGMKKGFLNSSPTSKPKSDNLIEISRKSTVAGKDFRVFDEVQQVIKEEQKAQQQQNTGNWLTNDILKQIEQDEYLARQFSNPYFMEAITLFQHKPQEALAKYGNNAEVMRFFDRMAKLLGNHFTSLSGKEDKQTMPKVDAEVNQLLQDEQVRQLLLDSDVMQLMKALREEPEKAQWLMRTANPSMRNKIKQLVDLGLLSVA